MKRLAGLFILLCLVQIAHADERINVGGHAKYQFNQRYFEFGTLGAYAAGRTPSGHELDLRLNTSYRTENLETGIDGQMLAVGGDDLRIKKQLSLMPDLQPALFAGEDRRLFDLESGLINDGEFASVGRLDRLFLGHRTENFVARAGRQAISWGNGLVFHALDPFNPFSPTAIDREYKAGDDMLFSQWALESGHDLQTLAIGRRDPETGHITADESSFALKYRGRSESTSTDYDLVLAQHFAELFAGAGFSRAIMEAVLRFDFSYARGEEQDHIVNFVLNLDRSFVVWDKNLYLFVEYFRSGAGQGDGDYLPLGPDLSDRIVRSEIFTLARDYLAAGGYLELTPLIKIFLNHIWNLNDRSGILQSRAEFDTFEDLFLIVGIDLPYGAGGSEFGGISIGDARATPPVQAYFRAALYY